MSEKPATIEEGRAACALLRDARTPTEALAALEAISAIAKRGWAIDEKVKALMTPEQLARYEREHS